MCFRRLLFGLLCLTLFGAGSCSAQLGDILGNILGKVVTGQKVTLKDAVSEIGKVVAIEASISVIKSFEWYDSRTGRTVTLDDYCRSVLCSPSLAGTEFDADPVGTIIRGIAYRDHLLDAAIFRTSTGSVVSIRQAHDLGYNRQLTASLIDLYGRVKGAYRQQNVLGFAGGLSEFLATLALNNETITPPVPVSPVPQYQEVPAVAEASAQEYPTSTGIETPPVKAQEEVVPPPVAQPVTSPETVESRAEEEAVPEEGPPSPVVTAPPSVPVSTGPAPAPAFPSSHMITKVLGRFAYVSLAESRAVRVGSLCVFYIPTNVGRQPVAEGYVTTMKSSSCIVEIQRVYSETALKRYSTLAPEFNKKLTVAR